jgi:hypothetical protein
MSARKNPFATLTDASQFEPKPPRLQPVSNDAIEQIAERRNFPSREAPRPKAEPARKQRRYRTGRNQHLGVKATAETCERFINTADKRNLPYGELLRLALDALEKLEANAGRE